MSDHEEQGRLAAVVAHRVDQHLADAERDALREWLQGLLEIRASNLPARTKARHALQATDSSVILPAARGIGEVIKEKVWDDRTWSSRLGLGGVAVGVLTFGGQGAGIAALGSAVGAPLWIVLGAGGSFAGMLLDELKRSRSRPQLQDGISSEPIMEAEWSYWDPAGDGLVAASGAAALIDEPGREPLRKVFMRAYRSARERQHAADAERDRTLLPPLNPAPE
jgi:hypothetical protein